MVEYKKHSLTRYLKALDAKKPTPGGGSAAALTGALGAALIGMVARYSEGKGKGQAFDRKVKKTIKESEKIRLKLLDLVDKDAEAYRQVMATRKEDKRKHEAALRRARQIPFEVCQQCYSAIQLTPFLVKEGNRHLITDIECAGELLLAAFTAALTFQQHN